MGDDAEVDALEGRVVHGERRRVVELRPREEPAVVRKPDVVCQHANRLRDPPVVPGKGQRHIGGSVPSLLVVGTLEPEGQRALLALFGRRDRRQRVDYHLGVGPARQHDLILVALRLTLGDDRGAAGDADRHERLVVVGHVGRDAEQFLPVETVVGALHLVDDETAVALEVVAHHRWRVAGHVEGVAAEPAEDLGDELLARALDEEPVVALGAVDAQQLDVDEVDVEAGAEHAVLGDHEVVAELGADHDDRVEPVTAVDVHRRVHRVLYEVRTSSAGDVGALALGLLRAGQGEGADLEGVLTEAAIQLQHRLVVEGHEPVVARAAVDGHRLADAVGQEAPGRLDVGEDVVRQGDTRRIGVAILVGVDLVTAGRLVELSDLEGVVSGTAVERRHGPRVIDGEVVFAEAAVHYELFHEGVVHPLDRRRLIDGVWRRHVQEGHERERSVGIGSQQELIVEDRAGRLEDVHVARPGAAVEDRHERRRVATFELHQVGVAAFLAVEDVRALAADEGVPVVAALDVVRPGAAV